VKLIALGEPSNDVVEPASGRRSHCAMLDGRLGKKMIKIKTTEVHRKAAATGA
jgi:hypothetical protein